MATKLKAKPKAKKEKSLTKSQMASELASKTGLTKSQIAEVFISLYDIIGEELKAGRPVAITGLVKITLTHKPATVSRPGRNPFTGEAITIKAKPARKVVKVRALKALKEIL